MYLEVSNVTWADNAHHKNQQQQKPTSTNQEKPPFQQLVKVVQVTPKTIWTIDVTLGCLSEVKVKLILMKTWGLHYLIRI